MESESVVFFARWVYIIISTLMRFSMMQIICKTLLSIIDMQAAAHIQKPIHSLCRWKRCVIKNFGCGGGGKRGLYYQGRKPVETPFWCVRTCHWKCPPHRETNWREATPLERAFLQPRDTPCRNGRRKREARRNRCSDYWWSHGKGPGSEKTRYSPNEQTLHWKSETTFC